MMASGGGEPGTDGDDGDVPLSTGVAGALGECEVVIVDDSSDNLELLEMVLRDAGVARVRTFSDPRAAIASCIEACPDLVMLDLHMPHLDGIAVMRALSDALPDGSFLPVIVMTADVTAGARQRALSAGAKDFVVKPFEHTEVILRVKNLLETRTLYGRLEQQNVDLRAELDAHSIGEREAAAERHRRVVRIDDVLARNAITIVFQPIADVVTGAIVGAEALARFEDGLVRTPDVWFAEAADVGRGADLELAAIRAAVEQIDCMPDHAFLSLNVSPATAITAGLADILRRAPADRLVVELTEHARVDDYPTLLVALDRLRAMGARIAVDDTGAGYASLQHLLRLGADIMKLDISLTRDIDVDPVRRSLAAALVAFADEVGAVIIAEGVQRPGELDVLRGLGVRWAQGYYLARPAPLPLPAHIASIAEHEG